MGIYPMKSSRNCCAPGWGLLELGQLEVRTGTLQATNARLSKVVTAAVERLGNWVRQRAHVQVDETPWLVKGIKEWMWVVCGEGFCLFHAGDTRSRAELETLLGQSFAGVLSSDDFSLYNGYPVTAQQKCLAHLRRHFKKVIKLKHGDNPQLGQVFIDLIDADECGTSPMARDARKRVLTAVGPRASKPMCKRHSTSGCRHPVMRRVCCCEGVSAEEYSPAEPPPRYATKLISGGISSTIQRCLLTIIVPNVPCA